MTEKRKRAAPTIDLKATEVPSPDGDAAPEQAAAQPEEPQAQPAGPPPRDFAKTIAMSLAAGCAGAIFGGAIVWGLAPRSANDAAQLATLQKQVQSLQNRPAPAGDTQALDTLRARVARIEQTVANLPPGEKALADRVAAAENAMKSLGIALTALNKRSDDAAADAKQAEQSAAAAEKAVGELRTSVQSAKQQAASAVDAGQLDEVRKKLAALEQSMKDARAQLAQTATTDKAARLALSAAALRAAVESGSPYQAELAQAKELGAPANEIAALEPFAASGIPSKDLLAHDLNLLIPKLVKAAGVTDTPNGFLARLQANASRLVRVTPMNAPAGDDPSDVLSRLEIAAARADLASALAEVGKLPPAARQQAASWVGQAEARHKALGAARKLVAETARGLAVP
ncbi:MAG TPA: mitofilin family membrane protein [Pseudolabrys sp.]|nr:mitofilin family membrane protein [Pseudolabrys sp.]